MQANGRVNNIVKWANVCNNGVSKMEFCSFNSRENDEHNDIGLTTISEMQDDFVDGAAQFVRLWLAC